MTGDRKQGVRPTRRALVKEALKATWRSVFVVGVLSLVLSIVPTLKSELEAAIIEQVDRGISEAEGDLGSALSEPIHRLNESSEEGGVEGVVVSALSLLYENMSLWGALVIYGGITLVAFLLGVLSAGARARVARAFFGAFRREAMARALVSRTRPAEGINVPGQQASAIQAGANSLAGAYSFWLSAPQHVFALATSLLLVASKSYWFASAIAAVILAQMAVSWAQAKWLQSDREKLDNRRNLLNSHSDEVLSKRDLILAYERDDHYKERLLADADEYGRIEQKLAWHEEFFRGLTSVLFDVGRILVLLIAFIIAYTRDSAAISDIGDAYFLLALYWRMVAPANNLRIGFDQMRRARATSQSFLELLAENPPHHSAREDLGDPDSTADPAIQFEDVHFAYEQRDGSSRNVLRGCSFRVPARKTTLIVGRSGSGKTTIARILLGFIDPDGGRIVVEGRELSGWTPSELRARMSYISQGDHIVDDSIRANFLTDEVSDDEMLSTLRRVGVQNNELDESAKHLSTGQQQRVALARMLADKSDIVIMDEPLAGLDAFTFRDVSSELGHFLTSGDRTILMVSHRLSFAAHADHVVVLGADGRVIEEGSRDELLSKHGEFHALHSAALDELQSS